jgi:hypothetical protein
MEYQVEVIAHQALDVTFGAELRETDRYDLQEPPAIDVVNENSFLAIAARHDVIDRAAKSDPMLSGHAEV